MITKSNESSFYNKDVTFDFSLLSLNLNLTILPRILQGRASFVAFLDKERERTPHFIIIFRADFVFTSTHRRETDGAVYVRRRDGVGNVGVLIFCCRSGSHSDLAYDRRISDKVYAISTDNAAVRATRWAHILCFVHTINLIIKDGLKLTQVLKTKIKKIVEYFHKSSHTTTKF